LILFIKKIKKSFADGCLVLGCIHDISNTELIVSLPGIGNYGHVKLNNISRIYSQMLKDEDQEAESAANEDEQVKTLNGMFNKGDLVRCRVLNFVDKRLYLTMEPGEVNSSLNYDNLEVEMVNKIDILFYS
jgi:exosome complex RNA-binding protein Csl4